MIDFLKSLPDEISIPYLSFKLLDKMRDSGLVRFNKYLSIYTGDVYGQLKYYGNAEKSYIFITIPLCNLGKLRVSSSNFDMHIPNRKLIDEFIEHIESIAVINDPYFLILTIGRDPFNFSKFKSRIPMEHLTEVLFEEMENLGKN